MQRELNALAVSVYTYLTDAFPDIFERLAVDLAEEVTGTKWAHSEARNSMRSIRGLQRTLFDRGSTHSRKDWDPSLMVPFKGPLLYSIVRLMKPSLVLETGVQAGVSTTFLLMALRDNGKGELISFDLSGDAGWIIPPEIKDRWRLCPGDSRIRLPEVFADSRHPDIFLHDGLHTYENMMFEFRLAAEALAPDGLIISDDVHWNRSFHDFCASRSLDPRVSHGIGIVRIRGGGAHSKT